jgi:translation initiation factor 3 subunit A
MASSAFFHKPELALRRAIELEGINQDDAALSLLHEILSSRRNRTWSPAYEQIMVAYIDLCLKLFKSREAKDGLHQYRNLSQSQAPGSLEKVIRYLMEQAEKKCIEAQAFVDAETLASATEDSDGEGFGASPQDILLSTMSTDPAKSQRDSALLLPSLKFLWEIYRAVLDILRSNSKLEHVYHTAAQGALNFCRIYKRRMEFRHLCDMLRMHLGNLRQYGGSGDTIEESKSNNKVRGWEGWTTESIELHLQTRFCQLETASVLHRYTEGFRTVEDIYNILQISHNRRKNKPDTPPPKAKLMANYYEKLTTLFWVSENHLFHAFAWWKYYSLCMEYNRGMSAEQKEMQASAVLLAALCIPQLPAGMTNHTEHGIASTIQDDIVKQKMGRMATLLGFHTRNPTREGLLAELKSKNILDQVPQYLRDLYLLLENATDPLILVEQTRPLLEQLRKQVGSTTTTDSEQDNEDVKDATLGRYVKPLTKVLLLKLVVNLSQAYHTVSMDHLIKLTSGLDMSFEEVEKSIVLLTQTKTLSVRIDHRAGCLRFGDSTLEADTMRMQLTVLSKQLEAVNQILTPADTSGAKSIKAKLYSEIRSSLDSEHDAVLERKNLIEKRKELAERLAQDKTREEQRVKAEEEAARRAEEDKRIAREQRIREQDKLRKIQQELENQEKKRFLQAVRTSTPFFVFVERHVSHRYALSILFVIILL